MDPIDLFIGSEGTLCVVSEVDLRIIPLPSAIWGITAFLPAPESALEFVARLKSAEHPAAAIEFFDGRALDLLRRQKSTNPAFASIPDLPRRWNTAVYAEYHGEDAYVEEAAAEMSDLMVKSGGDGDATWVASDAHELLRLKQFRHAVPESVNLLIDERRRTEPTLTKLGTDLAVPDGHLADVMAMYQEGLSRVGLEFVIFGHIGNNHVHVNILPRNLAEYDHGKALYLEWARRVVAMGGTVSAEHGIGKLKAALLREMYGEEGIRQMRAVKTAFDPGWVLNPGNLFDRG
jgi:D-lactate dehydrogenase (cytochrome)